MSNQILTVIESHSGSRWRIRVRGVAAVVLLAAASAMPMAASAAPANCAARADLLKQLAKQFNEAPIAIGLSNSGTLVEVLTSDSGATWTIVMSKPNGTSCLVAAGQEWQALKRAASRDLGT